MERARPILPAVGLAAAWWAACLLPPTRATAAPTPDASSGAATPEAVWQKARDAYRRGDFKAYIESVSPQAHDECVCEITFLVGMAMSGGMLGSDQDLKEMNEILRRHGAAEIRPGAPDPGAKERAGLMGRKAIHLVGDKVGLYAEMMAFLARHRIGGRLPASMAVELTDVRIDGARATASRGKFRDVAFDRIGGSWFLRPPPVCLDDIFRDEKAP